MAYEVRCGRLVRVARGTYAADRQPTLERLFVEPARRSPGRRFVLGGSSYPADFPWTANMWFMNHVAPPDHPAFDRYPTAATTVIDFETSDWAAIDWAGGRARDFVTPRGLE